MNTFATGSLPVHFSVAKLFNFRWQYTLFKLSALTPARALRRGGDHSIAEASVMNV